MLNDIATFQGSQRQVYGPNAHWNDQVVRGKGTTRCLWHACKALGLGLILMLLGACMATIGYYADQLSIAQEIRGNLTINVKNESRGFHLNNLSYAGPIVMGIGGFIVVAACVMTFETRDSAAKVVPARFRFNQISTINNVQNQQNRKSTSSQTARWDHQLCKYRANKSLSPMHEISRNHIVTEFIQISKEAHEKKIKHPFRKSPSAPNLLDNKSSKKKLHNLREGCLILNPKLLRRHALSVDNSGDNSKQKNEEAIEITKFKDSQVSMAMDLYSPNKGLLTIKVKDRLSTERRHQLSRQMRVEDVMDLEQAKQI